MKKPKEIKELRCSECGSNQIYRRITTNEKVCKRCGNIEKIEENKE